MPLGAKLCWTVGPNFYEAIRQQPDFMRAYESLGQLLYRIGDLAGAAEIYGEWLKRDPENPVARHMAAATSGQNVPERADSAYVSRLFDKYARTFDQNLKELGYRAPEVIASTLAPLLEGRTDKPDILDAGCGTGLCGPLLRPHLRVVALEQRAEVGVELRQNRCAVGRPEVEGSTDEKEAARQGNGYDAMHLHLRQGRAPEQSRASKLEAAHDERAIEHHGSSRE